MDIRLSNLDPLPRILAFDDFSNGLAGWTQLVGNYENTLDSMTRSYADHTPPQLSTLPNWDFGSHGAASGSYALKVQTLPRRGVRSVAIKRLTFRKPGPIRLEFVFTFKPEAQAMQLLETDVRSFGFLYDLQSGDTDPNPARVMPHMRFLNAQDGEHVQKWQFKRALSAVRPIGNTNRTATHDHLAPEGWEDLPGAAQKLCYNEIPTKVNWHYARFDFDLATWTATRFQVNDRVHDIAAYEPMRMTGWRNLWCMLNLAFFVETDVDRRAFLYIDSVCLSGDA